ncbi:DNA-binding protein P3A2 [Hyalella azteca]|uniref:DNA-binding protein P3A2 n=1 Tax=Hyalella azteca TaxID=294128 RepID=A0A979FWK9_HYAAZ|nr:DNA-binding protein P3A2 [Hyalella azteca]
MMNGMCGSSGGGAVIIRAVEGRSTVDASSALSGLTSDMSESIVAESLESPTGGLSPSQHALSSPQNLSDDDDMPLSPESFDDDGGSSPYFSPNYDDVTAQLAAAGGWAGPVGVAAAAAIASAKKRKKHHCFELNPSIRKRQQTRLLRKLKLTIDEYSTRVGQQAVVLVATPSKSGNNFKCFGAKPLEDVIKSLRQMIMSELETALALQAPPPPQEDPSLYELPPLVIDGIPTPVEKMTQAQLRAFIPLMLKYSTGRGKPGWGRDTTRPAWWPREVPWANVRMDARSEDQKHKISWTTALRQVVINCYKYHGRDDLLPAFVEDDEKSQGMTGDINLMNSSVLTASVVQGGNSNVCSVSGGNTSDNSGTTIFSGPIVQTVSNHDGTVSIIQVDPNNPVIHLPDGTTAQVQGIAHVTGDGGDSDGGMQTVSLDLNQHTTEATIGQDGSIIITGVDGTQIPVSVSGAYCSSSLSGMISVPLYHTVVANIHGSDGQPLHVVTPIAQVPKLEPGLDGGGLSGVEVATLNTSLDGNIIATTSGHHTIDDDDGNKQQRTHAIHVVQHKGHN